MKEGNEGRCYKNDKTMLHEGQTEQLALHIIYKHTVTWSDLHHPLKLLFIGMIKD